MRDSKRGHDLRNRANGASKQQEPCKEEQMIRSDQDVMNAGGQEFLDDRERALARAGKVVERAASAVEHGLGQPVAFVDVEEGLMLRVVWKQARGDGDDAGAPIEEVLNRKTQ